MADLHIDCFDMINPFVIASSPATRGADNVIKSSACKPGAITMRNYGHGMGGGGFFYPSFDAVLKGQPAFHSHAVGKQLPDTMSSLEEYCEEVRRARRDMYPETKLWASVGHYHDIEKYPDWKERWVKEAKEVVAAGADAIELHFNTPGVATASDRQFNYYQLVANCTRMIKKAVPGTPVMVKLAIEDCDCLTSIREAVAAGADAVGPTARWKAFYFDLDWKTTQPRPGSGYGGTQANPLVCFEIADARSRGITIPMYAGGGVFSYDQALRYIMAGSEMVQLGAIACSGGIKVCERIIRQCSEWLDKNGYSSVKEIKGQALQLFTMDNAFAKRRQDKLGEAYRLRDADPEKCIGCGRCTDVCWYKGIELDGKKARKTANCIGCGYCFQVCPTKALEVDAAGILKSAFEEK